jgi:hypothetical protein
MSEPMPVLEALFSDLPPSIDKGWRPATAAEQGKFVHVRCGTPALIHPHCPQVWGCPNPECDAFRSDSPGVFFEQESVWKRIRAGRNWET